MFPKSLSFQPIHTEQYCTSGDVTIFPGAAIAPGVLLQADAGSRIIVRSGVCIGLGCVLHASHGTITLNEGANLGAGVLLIGDVTIGTRACLGAAVTVIDSEVEAGKILESGLIVGDRSRKSSIDALIETIPLNSAPINSDDSPSSKSNSPQSDFPTYGISSPATTAEPFSSPTVSGNSTCSSSLSSDPEINLYNHFQPDITIEANRTSGHTQTKSETDSEANDIPNTLPIVISTFQYPEAPVADRVPDTIHTANTTSAASVVLDNSGKPWQSCDPNPWDPTDHPPDETTCQITSKPKDPTPFDATRFSSQNYSSPYPPYPQSPPIATEPIASSNPPTISPPTVASTVAPTITLDNPVVDSRQPASAKPVYGQDYVNQMLGKMSGRA